VPAVVVSTAGVLLLSNIGSEPAGVTPPAAVDQAITAEMVFTPTPHPAVEATHTLAPQAKPKPHAVRKVATAELVPTRQEGYQESHQDEVAAAPLSITPQPESPATVAAASGGNPVMAKMLMAKLRSARNTILTMPQRAYSRMTGWFSDGEPPRPPADVPVQNLLNASM
jgi:hypothetical protein